MIITIVISTVSFIISYLLSETGLYCCSGTVVIATALILYFILSRRYGSRTDPCALFALSWLSGVGFSGMKLSWLAVEWENKTWVCFAAAWFSFFIIYEFLYYRIPNKEGSKGTRIFDKKSLNSSLYSVIIVLTLVSLASFSVEAMILGYIPLFTVGVPHAYSYFHISGVHYFTVIYVLVPSFAVLYYSNATAELSVRNIAVGICCLVSIILPLLLVSRSQLIFSLFFALFTLCFSASVPFKAAVRKHIPLIAAVSLSAVIILYVFITVRRAHSAEYLLGIFEMRNDDIPVWVAQPYIYIANNFDNFNCLVRDLESHTMGLKMLFPFFALTGMKFLKPELVSFPVYITKEELGTLTLFYDSYYDFGLAGVIILSAIIAGISCVLYKKCISLSESRGNTGNIHGNPVIYILMSQILTYLCFSFFTTWFSNPVSWFYCGSTVCAYVFVHLITKEITDHE